MAINSLQPSNAKDANFGNDFRGYSHVNASCNDFHPPRAERPAAVPKKKPTPDFRSRGGPAKFRRHLKAYGFVVVYFFSAMAAAVADLPAAIGIIACSYGVPAHII